MHFEWREKDEVNEAVVEKLSIDINVNKHIAQTLVQRGIEDFETAKNFFNPSKNDIHNPLLMKDMDKAVNRIQDALDNKENILVYGDYDVDGTTSVSLVYTFLRSYTQNIDYYVPDRFKEGYGISVQGIAFAAEQGVSLMIALDCGIRSIDICELAKERGIDMIICDHHLPGDTLPDAVAVLDPKRHDCTYPYKELSGCGIGFKLVQAMAESKGLPFSSIEEYLDLVSVSIASDLVDIQGENRVLAYYGLKRLNSEPRVGLQALIGQLPDGKELTISDIVFSIGPRINAAGRIDHAKNAVELLISREFKEAAKYTEVLQKNNEDRKETDSDITAEAIGRLDVDTKFTGKKSTVIYGDDWSKGVLGIVASRLVEQYYKPTIVFTQIDGVLTGSARSIKSFDIHTAIGQCGDLVEQYGGHMYAAGLTIKKENFEAFEKRFEEIAQEGLLNQELFPEIEYDVEIPIEAITPKFVEVLERMEPFGPGNMMPIFRSNGFTRAGKGRLLKEKHLKFSVPNNMGDYFDVIGFGLGDKIEVLESGKPFDMCYTLEYNIFRGQKNVQLKLRDIKYSEA